MDLKYSYPKQNLNAYSDSDLNQIKYIIIGSTICQPAQYPHSLHDGETFDTMCICTIVLWNLTLLVVINHAHLRITYQNANAMIKFKIYLVPTESGTIYFTSLCKNPPLMLLI